MFSSGDGALTTGTRATEGSASNPLSPPSLPFRKSKTNAPPPAPPVVHYYMNNLTNTRTPIENSETVLILTPLAKFYQEYWDNLLKISYPHDLVSIGFIIPKTKEGNAAYAELQAQVTKTQSGPKTKRFASITILRQDTESPLQSQSEAERHKMENQKVRRAAMAKARNSLLFTTMGPTTSWVLWLDADIIEFPPTLIQDLAAYDVPIIAPNCFQRYYNEDEKKNDIRGYDFNNWIDSPTAREMAAKMGKDDILLEGYAEMATYRSLMSKMYDPQGDPGTKTKLDGVGGAALLVKAEVHRDGAMFPPFAFYHLIETEGFAKMASRLNWASWGLPNYLVSTILHSILDPLLPHLSAHYYLASPYLTHHIGISLQRITSPSPLTLHGVLPFGGHWAALRAGLFCVYYQHSRVSIYLACDVLVTWLGSWVVVLHSVISRTISSTACWERKCGRFDRNLSHVTSDDVFQICMLNRIEHLSGTGLWVPN
jgi:mannan polymerase complexes MNN9 subunit